MSRTYDITISEFDLDRLEADLSAAERSAAEQTRRANENHAWALRAERERDEARKEIESIKKLLLDPNAVCINMRAEVVKRVENFAELVGFVGLEAFDMLHGKIAKLDWEELEHIHGPHPARDQLAAERALADRLADCLNNLWHHHSLTEASYDYIDNALAAWKEARCE